MCSGEKWANCRGVLLNRAFSADGFSYFPSPGALPQAGDETAPLALFHVRIADARVRRHILAPTALHQFTLGQCPSFAERQRNISAETATHYPSA